MQIEKHTTHPPAAKPGWVQLPGRTPVKDRLALGADRRPKPRRKWPIVCGAALLSAIIAGAFVARGAKGWLASYVRERTVSTLRQTFAGDVEYAHLSVSVYPRIIVRGDGLVLRQHNRSDVPPLIRIRSFSTDVGPWELLWPIRHVQKITLEGLMIAVPPGAEPRPEMPATKPRKKKVRPFKVVVDEIRADNAELQILPRDRNKLPRVFYIHHLELYNAGLRHVMSYRATLSNPRPAGEIASRGESWSWQADDPRLTPLSGAYTFTHADLASFHGLSGIVTSQGQFSGRLDRIDVRGNTSTPNFSLGINGRPVPLETEFHAVVDGATGNTILDDVHARLLNSEIRVHGGVIRDPGQKYRKILLDAESENASLQDLLCLVIKAHEPPLTGAISFQTQIEIPPGHGAIAERLRLNGQFNVTSARFSSLNVQKRLAGLSRRGLGDAEAESPGSVVSNLAGKYALQNDVMNFSTLTFGVPGAFVDLDGTYALRNEDVDFHGTLGLQSKLSQLTHGWKAVMLRPFNRIFERRDAGTVLPIKITGTRSDPKFGLDIGRVF